MNAIFHNAEELRLFHEQIRKLTYPVRPELVGRKLVQRSETIVSPSEIYDPVWQIPTRHVNCSACARPINTREHALCCWANVPVIGVMLVASFCTRTCIRRYAYGASQAQRDQQTKDLEAARQAEIAAAVKVINEKYDPLAAKIESQQIRFCVYCGRGIIRQDDSDNHFAKRYRCSCCPKGTGYLFCFGCGEAHKFEGRKRLCPNCRPPTVSPNRPLRIADAIAHINLHILGCKPSGVGNRPTSSVAANIARRVLETIARDNDVALGSREFKALSPKHELSPEASQLLIELFALTRMDTELEE